jgi:hypothetical protein
LKGIASSAAMAVVLGAAVISWSAYNRLTAVPNIERAEFRVLYSDARDKLDAFSRCRDVVGRPAVKVQNEAQIELQKNFAALQKTASESRFSKDRESVDLEIQLKDRNPDTKMEDHAVRCVRLSRFSLVDKIEVARSLDRTKKFLEKY